MYVLLYQYVTEGSDWKPHDYYKTLFLVKSHLSDIFIEESVQISARQLRGTVIQKETTANAAVSNFIVFISTQ